jgi:methylglutaconyl-CoA hydratase
LYGKTGRSGATGGYHSGSSSLRTGMSELIRVSRAGPIAENALARPDVHNAFDDQLIVALIEALLATEGDASVRAVVLTGDGASFSAGADLVWMRRMASAPEEDNRHDALRLAELMRTLAFLSKPTVAKINGSAFGGGVGLVACCDIAIAADTAKFGLTEVKLGLVPAVISPYVIDAIGARHALRYFQTGEIFDAAEALRVGLVHRVVAADALDAAVKEQTTLLAKAGPAALEHAKKLAHRVAGRILERRRLVDEENAALIARLRVSVEGQEGLSAFLDKRKPSWLG